MYPDCSASAACAALGLECKRWGGGGWGQDAGVKADDYMCVCGVGGEVGGGGESQGFTGCLSDWQTGALPPKQTHA